MFSKRTRPHLFLGTCAMTFVMAFAAPSFAGTPVSGEKHIFKNGEEIVIHVKGEDELSETYVIDADGSIQMPLIGRVNVTSQNGANIENKIEAALKDGYLKNPEVSVSYFAPPPAPVKAVTKAEVTQKHETKSTKAAVQAPKVSKNDIPSVPKDAIFVLGAVKNPGVYPFGGDLSHLLHAVALAGGYTDDANQSRFEIIRKTEKVYYRGMQDSGTYGLKPGDIIIIQAR